MRARVPPASPNLRRARAQNGSWAAVSTPLSRAWWVASAPGIAPGLRDEDLEVVVEQQGLAAPDDAPLVGGDDRARRR